MRAKAIFSVFGRKLPSGKRVFYYQCYDAKGNRQFAKSTGLAKKTEAVAYCTRLFRDGILIPEQKAPTFAEFSKGWWDKETCNYLKWRLLHDPIAESTISLYQCQYKLYIKDYFAKYRLDDITPDVIESWFLHMSEKIGKNKKKLTTKTINMVYKPLRLMMNEAVRKKLMKTNPCKEVKILKEEDVKREILTVEEVKKLFVPDWASIWNNKVAYYVNRLAACTGLRVGEILGLRCEFVHDDYIHVCGQFTARYGYKRETKTKKTRNVPITSLMRRELEELIQMNGSGYVFSEDGGETPITVERVRRCFERALNKIGITKEDVKQRNLTFHSWRHFLNTLLLMSDVSEKKVQSVTGHLTKEMTDRYTHFDTRQFTEVRNVQTELLTFNET